MAALVDFWVLKGEKMSHFLVINRAILRFLGSAVSTFHQNPWFYFFMPQIFQKNRGVPHGIDGRNLIRFPYIPKKYGGLLRASVSRSSKEFLG